MNTDEELYRCVVDAVPEGIWVANSQGETIFCNKRMADLLGTDVERLQRMTCFDPVFPEDVEEAKRQFALQMNDDRQPFDFRLRRMDGSEVWVRISCLPMYDGQGAIRGLLGLFSDISERRRSEEALRESEERFRNLADTAPVMIWMSGKDQQCTFFSKPWLDFTGRTLEQELGGGWAEGVHPADLDRCIAIYESSFDARRAFRMEYRLRRFDGAYRWILDIGSPRYRRGEFAGFIGSCVDVTGHRLIEERLRASEAQFLYAQRLAKVGSFEEDLVTSKFQWSEETCRIFGTTGPPSDFEAILTHLHPVDREKLIESDAKARSSIAPVVVDFRIVRPDGETRFARCAIEAIRDDQGVPLRLTGACQDITEQVEAESLLADRNQRLEESQHSLRLLSGQLIGAQEDERKRIARELHDDLNQQAASLGISLSKIKRGIPASMEEVRNEISSVQTRLQALSRGLRHVSHELHPGILELLGLVPALRSHCKEFTTVTSIPVEFETAWEEPVRSDQALCFYRMAQESLRNAAKHSRASRVRLSLTESGGLLQLTVSDNGIGFDLQTARAHGGLGLRSMEERVRLVRGNLELKSQPGQGTTLIVSIELNQRENVIPSARTMEPRAVIGRQM